jgi:two-component sensor histidine kinase
LVHPLIESLKNPYSKINLHIDIKDDVSLNINTSIPLGLLINEIITNSLKHGLKEAERGAIYLKIINKGNDKYLMTIGDNGTGFAPNFELENATSLGLQLVTSLAEQLSGTIHRDFSKQGTHYVVSFEELKQNK